MQHALGIFGLPNGDNISPAVFEVISSSTAFVKSFREDAEVSTSWLACLIRFPKSPNLEIVETVDRSWFRGPTARRGDTGIREHVVDYVAPDVGFVPLRLGCGICRWVVQRFGDGVSVEATDKLRDAPSFFETGNVPVSESATRECKSEESRVEERNLHRFCC